MLARFAQTSAAARVVVAGSVGGAGGGKGGVGGVWRSGGRGPR